jgi:hypothetical protein
MPVELAPRTVEEWAQIARAQGYTIRENPTVQQQLRPFYLCYDKKGDITGAVSAALIRKAFIHIVC